MRSHHIAKRIYITKILKASTLLFDGDSNAAYEWIVKDNEYFLGKRPIDLIIDGNGQLLLNWIEARI